MVLAPLLRTTLAFGFCNILKSENIRNDTFRKLFPSLGRDYGYLGRALYRTVCDDPLEEPDDPFFTGGQCEFCYKVRGSVTISNTGFSQLDGTFEREENFWGPVNFVSAEREGETPQGGFPYKVKISSHGGCGIGRLPSPGVVDFFSLSTTIDATETLNFLEVIPLNGEPDNCGSSPPPDRPILPPQDRRFPINIVLPGVTNNFEFVGNVAFGFAFFDNDFNLNIPLQFQLNNNININANFNLTLGDLNINWGSDFDFPNRPTPDGDYNIDPGADPPPSREPPPIDFDPPSDPPDDPLEDPEDFDPEKPQKAPRVRRIVGVLVDVAVDTSTSTEIAQSPNPDVLVPDMGLVNFAYLVGGARFYWSEDIRVKNRRQVIFTHPGRYAVDVRGTPRGNAQWTLTPLYENVVIPEVAPA